jgi:ATP-dependent DNA helicase RecQ
MKREPLAVLREVFGHTEFRGPQEEVIGHVVGGGDALVLAPTGIGKSATFQVASLCREGTGVVVSPLIALMHDQVQHLHAAGVRAAYLNSTQTQDQQRKVRDDLAAGRLDFVYVTPERMAMPGFQAVLSRTKISLFAVDEALRLAMGARFPPGIPGSRQTEGSVPVGSHDGAHRHGRSADEDRHPQGPAA